jgi:acyl-CoA synthetase (AMP-forming)/AMP-acid ligase II
VVARRPEAVPDEAALIAAIADRLARFKQPRRIFVADELPRNTMGKVQKNVLRERYRDVFSHLSRADDRDALAATPAAGRGQPYSKNEQ